MRAPLRRQNKLIGAKWLRNGEEEGQVSMAVEGSTQNQNQGVSGLGANHGVNISGGQLGGSNLDNSNSNNLIRGDKGDIGGNNRFIIMESKKRKTETGQTLGSHTELGVDSDEDDLTRMDQDGGSDPKNEYGASSGSRARLEL